MKQVKVCLTLYFSEVYMKRKVFLILTALLCAVVCVLSACSPAGSQVGNGTTENSGAAGNNTENTGNSGTTGAGGNEDTSKEAPPTTEKAKILIACFSCTGNTKAAAERIAALTGGDLYEIVPTEPYSSADLNYNNSGCRANREMNDPAVRPAIGSDKVDISAYDTVIIGYPIWWGTMPRIINTFLDTSHGAGGES